MKRLMIVLGALVLSTSVLMAEREWTNKVPEVGTVGVGLTFNVASMATQMQSQPNANTHLGPFLFDATDGLFNTPASMYILSQDPVAALRIKYRMTEHWNIRASIGFNGSHLDYSEYIRDDLAFALDPNSENKVVDHIKADLNSSNFAVGAEFTAGPRNLKFVAGVNLLYAFACFFGNNLHDFFFAFSNLHRLNFQIGCNTAVSAANERLMNEVMAIRQRKSPLFRY